MLGPAHTVLVGVLAFVGAITAARASPSCETITNPGGEDTYVLKGAPKDPFYCIALTNDSPPLQAKEVIRRQGEVQTCNVIQKDKIVSYQSTTDEQPLRCKFECRKGQFKCAAVPEAGDDTCVCVSTGPRAAIVPLSEDENLVATIQSSSGGDAVNSLLESICRFQPIDTVVSPEVNCQKIKKPFPKEFLTEMIKGAPLCLIKDHPKFKEDEDNNEVWVSFPGATGAKCNYVCRPGGYRCSAGSTPSRTTPCPCQNPPNILTPKLVPVDDSIQAKSSMRMLQPSAHDLEAGCQSDSQCGACGKCTSGTCTLREPGNHCTFGFKCASRTTLATNRLPGAPHHCEVNPALRNQICMEAPGDGTEVPNMRLDGEEDEMDVCTCSPNHVEVPVKFIEDKQIGPFCRPL